MLNRSYSTNMYSPYSPNYVTRISANGSAISLSHDTDGNLVTIILVM